jgi:hypothetical protein
MPEPVIEDKKVEVSQELELEKLRSQRTADEKRVEELQAQNRDLTVHGTIEKEITEVGIRPLVTNDELMIANRRSIFSDRKGRLHQHLRGSSSRLARGVLSPPSGRRHGINGGNKQMSTWSAIQTTPTDDSRCESCGLPGYALRTVANWNAGETYPNCGAESECERCHEWLPLYAPEQ